MTMTLVEAVALLSTLATEAQASGLVPGGTPALVLAGLVAGLQLAVKSGALTPQAPIEIDAIGTDFAAAMARLRAALAAGGAA